MYILKKRLANDFTSWKSVLRRKGHCKARVKFDINDDFVEQTNQYTCPLSQINCEFVKVRARIMWRATEAVMTKAQTLADQLARVSEDAAINLPVVENLRQNIHSAPQERNLPLLCINIAAIPVLLIELEITTSGDQFLLFDRGVRDAHRIVTFASVQTRQLLTESKNW